MTGNPTRISQTVIDATDVEKAGFRTAWDDGLINIYDSYATLHATDASAQTEIYVRSLKSLFRRISGSTEVVDGAEVLDDAAGNIFIRWPRTRWEPVAIVSSQASIDLSANDHFEITVDADCEIQAPMGGWPGMPFLLRIVFDGAGHGVTFASEWVGIAPTILDGSGDQTILSCMVIESSAPISALANLVQHIPA